MNSESELLESLVSAQDIKQLNNRLTKLMAERSIHAAIDGDKLKVLVDSILERSALVSDADRLLALAMLGRLANVARKRSETVLNGAQQLFRDKSPVSLDVLADGDERYYAALTISNMSANWVTEYCFFEAINTDTAEKARKELLKAALRESGTLSHFFSSLALYVKSLSLIENPESRAKRVRRILISLVEVCNEWKGECGASPGPQLAELVSTLQLTRDSIEDQVFGDIADAVLELLLRVIQLRFSFALLSESYSVLSVLKRVLGRSIWDTYIRRSAQVVGLRECLLETVLVLARQNKTDDAFLSLLSEVYGSRSNISLPLKKRLELAQDIDPGIRDWWASGGKKKREEGSPEHKVDVSVDQQIGSLMIEVSGAQAPMAKLNSAVVPILGISEPVLAASVKSAANGYVNIDRIAKQLARMRKLQLTDIKGARIEYNAMEHDMLGGHQSGVRMVKVVREGVQKDFSGRIKTLVKAWVEPIKD
ncbi:hypothetical protein [uncultured Amphritea sp.]|uniref:hypothetical protein n=1 Tax=uncultured Amphritea sp. TaxID=981605 RepID=UPI002608332E|nr:hypothetical protein [uncultured Amphritea sp.]